MDLYAQPIPPEMAIPSSRVNLREALLQRLTEVQQQKQLSVPTKSVESSDAEQSLLIEMLEKAQKLQSTSQVAWSREKQELLAQIRSLETALKTAVESRGKSEERKDVHSDGKREGTKAEERKEGPKQKAEEQKQKTEEQSKAKADRKVEEQTKAKAERKQEEQKQKAGEDAKAKAEAQLRSKVAALEKKLSEVTKALEEAQTEIEECHFLQDEQRVTIESLEEQLRSSVVPAKSLRSQCSQTESLETENEVRLRTEKEELSSQVAGLHSVIQEQQELILSLKAARAASKPRLAPGTQSSSLVIEQLLAEFEEQSLSFLLIKQEVSGLSSLLQTLQTYCEAESVTERGDETATCKQTLAAAVICITKLKEVISDLVKGKSTAEETETAALLAEIAMLRKQQQAIGEHMRAVQQVKTTLRALLDPVSVALQSCLPALQEAESMKDRQSELLSDLKACVAGAAEQQSPCRHIDQIDELATNIRILQDEFHSYKSKVTKDKAKFSEQLFKIAESLEYRKDLWEQLQNLEADEEQMEKLTSLSEELERQSEWETSNLALLITWMQESPPAQETAQKRTSISTILEEEEDDEPDDRTIQPPSPC